MCTKHVGRQHSSSVTWIFMWYMCVCGVWGNICKHSVLFSMNMEQAGSHWLYFFTVYARDRGSPPLLTHVTVRVAVEDENDHAPAFGSTHLTLEVPEGQDPQTLTKLRASDPDEGANGQLQYHILGKNPSGSTKPDLFAHFLFPVGLCQTQLICLLLFPKFCVIHSFPLCIYQCFR